MAQSIVVLTNDSIAKPAADRASAELARLGFNVDRGKANAPARAQAAKIEAAHRVIVLWSRTAPGTPALRQAVRRARAKGTLVYVGVCVGVCVGARAGLNAAPQLTGAKRLNRLPRTGAAWQSALSRHRPPEETKKIARPQTRPARARRDAATDGDSSVQATIPHRAASRSAPILGFLATMLVFGAAVGVGLYQTDPSFAAKVKTLANQAQVQVAALTAKH